MHKKHKTVRTKVEPPEFEILGGSHGLDQSFRKKIAEPPSSCVSLLVFAFFLFLLSDLPFRISLHKVWIIFSNDREERAR